MVEDDEILSSSIRDTIQIAGGEYFPSEMSLAHKVEQASDIFWVRSPHIDFDLMSMSAASDDNITWNRGYNRTKKFLSRDGRHRDERDGPEGAIYIHAYWSYQESADSDAWRDYG